MSDIDKLRALVEVLTHGAKKVTAETRRREAAFGGWTEANGKLRRLAPELLAVVEAVRAERGRGAIDARTDRELSWAVGRALDALDAKVAEVLP